MTILPPDATAGKKIVRKKLADGTIKEYTYARAVKRPSRFLAESGQAIRNLAIAYTQSPEFRILSAQWQAGTRYYLGILEDELGWMTFGNLTDRRARAEFYRVRDANAQKPNRADKIVNVLKRLLSWSYERGMIEANHAVGIGKLVSSSDTRADKIWSQDQIAALLAVADPEFGKIVRFALLTAARRSDIIGLRWDQFDGRWIEYTPSKTARSTKVRIRLPTHELAPLASLMSELSRSTDYLFSTGDRAVPWGFENVQRHWRRSLTLASLQDADRHFHDLRGTAITRLLEAGASDAETASISGHSVGGKSMLRAYAARTDDLAINAYRKLNRILTEKPVVVALETARKPRGK